MSNEQNMQEKTLNEPLNNNQIDIKYRNKRRKRRKRRG